MSIFCQNKCYFPLLSLPVSSRFWPQSSRKLSVESEHLSGVFSHADFSERKRLNTCVKPSWWVISVIMHFEIVRLTIHQTCIKVCICVFRIRRSSSDHSRLKLRTERPAQHKITLCRSGSEPRWERHFRVQSSVFLQVYTCFCVLCHSCGQLFMTSMTSFSWCLWGIG